MHRISLNGSEEDQPLNFPLQVHYSQQTYPSVSGDLEHLERQVQQWKTKFTHLQSHLQKFEQFKVKYDKLIKRNRDLENNQRQKQFQIEDLNKELERKSEQLLQNQRKKKLQLDQALRCHRVQTQNLKIQNQHFQSKILCIQSQQRKNKRNFERQLNKIKEQLNDAKQQLSLNKEATDRYKGQNIILKKKIQDIQGTKQLPLQRNNHLFSQVQSLTSQITIKNGQILNNNQIINRLQTSLKLELQKSKQLIKQIQQLKTQHQCRIKKINIEIEKLKAKQSQYLLFQDLFNKQKKQIQAKNEQIDILLKKIDESCKISARSHNNSDNHQYYNELNKLQQDIYKKHTQHKKQKQILQQRLIQLQSQFDIQMLRKNKIIEEKSLTILSINNNFENLKRKQQYFINDSKQQNQKYKQTIMLLKRKLQVCQINLQDLKILTVKMQDKINFLETKNERLLQDNKILQQKHSQLLVQFQEHIMNNRQKQNYQNNTNRMEVQQLYQAKLSSKDELIQLLKLKLKNVEPGDCFNKTRTTLFY